MARISANRIAGFIGISSNNRSNSSQFFTAPLPLSLTVSLTGVTAGSKSRCRFRGQADFGDVELLEDVQHVDHVLVIHLVRALHHHPQIRVVRLESAASRFSDSGMVTGASFKYVCPFASTSIWLIFGFLSAGRRFARGQVHFQVVHHLRRGDDEDHQQHKHQIQQRRDVQFAQRAVLGMDSFSLQHGFGFLLHVKPDGHARREIRRRRTVQVVDRGEQPFAPTRPISGCRSLSRPGR